MVRHHQKDDLKHLQSNVQQASQLVRRLEDATQKFGWLQQQRLPATSAANAAQDWHRCNTALKEAKGLAAAMTAREQRLCKLCNQPFCASLAGGMVVVRSVHNWWQLSVGVDNGMCCANGSPCVLPQGAVPADEPRLSGTCRIVA